MPEDGELPVIAPSPPPSGKKRKHAPIVWHTPPKAARAELPSVGSCKGLEGLGAGGAAGAAPKSAAERALDEVLAFQAQQLGAEGGGEGGDDEQPFMKPSPSVSSEEEEEELGAAQRGALMGRRTHCLHWPAPGACRCFQLQAQAWA